MAPSLHKCLLCKHEDLHLTAPTPTETSPPGGDKRIRARRSLSQSKQSVSTRSVKNDWRRHPNVDLQLPYTTHQNWTCQTHTPTIYSKTLVLTYSPHVVSRDRTLEFKGNHNYTAGRWGQPELTVSQGNPLKNFRNFLTEKRIHSVVSGIITFPSYISD